VIGQIRNAEYVDAPAINSRHVLYATSGYSYDTILLRSDVFVNNTRIKTEVILVRYFLKCFVD